MEGWSRGTDGRSVLAVRVRAAPIEGEANAALERLIAKALALPPSAVRVARGGKGRLKAVAVDGADAVERAFGKP